jgi:hypothetical protein
MTRYWISPQKNKKVLLELRNVEPPQELLDAYDMIEVDWHIYYFYKFTGIRLLKENTDGSETP